MKICFIPFFFLNIIPQLLMLLFLTCSSDLFQDRLFSFFFFFSFKKIHHQTLWVMIWYIRLQQMGVLLFVRIHTNICIKFDLLACCGLMLEWSVYKPPWINKKKPFLCPDQMLKPGFKFYFTCRKVPQCQDQIFFSKLLHSMGVMST